MATTDDRLAERLAAAQLPHVPRAQREGRVSPSREIACRSCGRWMTCAQGDGRFRHIADASLACVDPASLQPYVCPRHGGELERFGSCWECDGEVSIAEADRSEYEGLDP